MANKRNAKKPPVIDPVTGEPVVVKRKPRKKSKGGLDTAIAQKNARARKNRAAAANKPAAPKKTPAKKPAAPKKATLQVQQEEMQPVIDQLAEQLGIVVADTSSAISSVADAVISPAKKRAPRKKTEPCSKSRVVKVTFTSPDAKTKRRKYRALCADGGARLITRAQYAAYAAKDGVEARPLPALRKKKAGAKKNARMPKRSDEGAYCGAYGESYTKKCMRLLNNPETCASVGSARREFCVKDHAQVRVSRVRSCASISKSTKTRALNKKLSEEEAKKRAKKSLENCRKKRSSKKKPVTKGRYTVTDEPRRRKPKST